MNDLIMEILKTGGPVALLIVLGFIERRAFLHQHFTHQEMYMKMLMDVNESLKELVVTVRERLL